jgi:hypothetical protein
VLRQHARIRHARIRHARVNTARAKHAPIEHTKVRRQGRACPRLLFLQGTREPANPGLRISYTGDITGTSGICLAVSRVTLRWVT